MPYQDGLPFARDSHTSYKAAVALRRDGTRGVKLQRLLTAYREAGEDGLTDHEAAFLTGLPVQSICSLRNAAVDCGLVRKAGERVGHYGKANQVWILTAEREAGYKAITSTRGTTEAVGRPKVNDTAG